MLRMPLNRKKEGTKATRIMGREANPSYPVYWGTALQESLEPLPNAPKMALNASQEVTGVESRILTTLARRVS
jgi:hypothetical protein